MNYGLDGRFLERIKDETSRRSVTCAGADLFGHGHDAAFVILLARRSERMLAS
jgi:hypothetical protein